MHSTANCVKAEANCYFTTAANLRTPEGPIGFPDDLWARQTTTVRTMDRTVLPRIGLRRAQHSDVQIHWAH